MKLGIHNLNLFISAIVVILAGLVYGGAPSTFLPGFLGIEPRELELKNILRSIMGIYWGFAAYWLLGGFRKDHWKGATASNVFFMGGLGFGRILSTIIDGVSVPFTGGLVLELFMMGWSLFNLSKFKASVKSE